MRIHQIFATLLTCLLTYGTAPAQPFRMVELPNQELLPVANVHRIMQDSEGFIWYATEGGGLCRDDGYRIEIFRADRRNPALIESNDITCITEDRQKRIWFGTRKGAYILDKKDGYRIHPLEETHIKSTYIHGIQATTDGSVWIATEGRLFRFPSTYSTTEPAAPGKDTRHADSISVYATEWNGHPVHITDLHEDCKGRLWAALSAGGLLCFDTDAESPEPMEWPLHRNASHITAGRTANELWIGTWGQGIVRYDMAAPTSAPHATLQPVSIGPDGAGSFRSQILNVLYDKRHDLLWAAAMDDLYAYRITPDNRLTPYDTKSFLPSGKKILDNVILDRQGNLWVPGYSPHTFILQPSAPRLRRDSVKAMSDLTGYRVMVDRIARADGRYYWIWQGRTNLSLYDAQENRMVFAGRAAIPSPVHTAKCMERRRTADGIWSCHGKRLLVFRNRGMEILWNEVTAAKPDEDITALFDDGRGRLYIGTRTVLYEYRYDKDTFSRLMTETGPVIEIAATPHGAVYLISESKGLCRIASKTDGNPSLQSLCSENKTQNGFSSLALAPDGSVWAGTTGGTVYHYTPADGQLTENSKAGYSNGDAVKRIVTDRQGHVWVLADKYLKEYNPATEQLRILHSASPDIDMDYFHTIVTDGDSVCLGGIGAFCMIAPMTDDGHENLTPVPTTWTVDGTHHLPAPGEHILELTAKSKDVDIYISTLDYLYADSIQFAYRLDHEEWTVLPKGQNRITPARIPYGTSRLEVKATDRYGAWQEAAVCLVIHRKRNRIALAATSLLAALITAVGIRLYRQHRRPSVPSSTTDNPAPSHSATSAPMKKTATVPTAPAVDRNRKADEDFLRHAQEAVERNLDNADYSVEEFSSDLCMSRMNLYRKLQALTAQKPSEFIRDIRLAKAVELMQSADIPTAEIADRVGFGTPRYFSKCFKEKYGVSPSQYRNTHTATPDQSATTEEQM